MPDPIPCCDNGNYELKLWELKLGTDLLYRVWARCQVKKDGMQLLWSESSSNPAAIIPISSGLTMTQAAIQPPAPVIVAHSPVTWCVFDNHDLVATITSDLVDPYGGDFTFSNTAPSVTIAIVAKKYITAAIRADCQG
jgi:hypothetical protein